MFVRAEHTYVDGEFHVGEEAVGVLQIHDLLRIADRALVARVVSAGT